MIALHHIPNALSLFRVALIFPMVLTWAFAPAAWHSPVLLGCFLLAAVSDFLDGYLARKFHLQSDFGAMIDQISDKLVVCTLLLLLVADRVILPYAPLMILLREIYVSGLREYMGLKQVPMPVSKLGKWKTASQMVAILALLSARALALPFEFSDQLMFGLFALGNGLLWVAAVLALVSSVQYSRAVLVK